MSDNNIMSFGDFVFPILPEVIRISGENSISSEMNVQGGSSTEMLGKKPAVISGKGYFTGENCMEVFDRLKSTAGGGGVLCIPLRMPVYALLKSLELICEDMENAVGYSFEFIESEDGTSQLRRKLYGSGSSTLWDFSEKYGIHIDVLRELNPHIKRPDIPISENERVIIC